METINALEKIVFVVLLFSLQDILILGGPFWPLAAATPGALAAPGGP